MWASHRANIGWPTYIAFPKQRNEEEVIAEQQRFIGRFQCSRSERYVYLSKVFGRRSTWKKPSCGWFSIVQHVRGFLAKNIFTATLILEIAFWRVSDSRAGRVPDDLEAWNELPVGKWWNGCPAERVSRRIHIDDIHLQCPGCAKDMEQSCIIHVYV